MGPTKLKIEEPMLKGSITYFAKASDTNEFEENSFPSFSTGTSTKATEIGVFKASKPDGVVLCELEAIMLQK